MCLKYLLFSPQTKLLSALHKQWRTKQNKGYIMVTAASECRHTFHGLGVGLAAALTHLVEKLVHLFQWQQVVQRLQWVDRGHHGAAFKACSTDRGDRNTAGRTTSPSNGGGRGGVVTLQLSVHVGCFAHSVEAKRWQAGPKSSAAIFIC